MRLARGQAEADPFFRQILSGGRGLICILSAIACLHQLCGCGILDIAWMRFQTKITCVYGVAGSKMIWASEICRRSRTFSFSIISMNASSAKKK